MEVLGSNLTQWFKSHNGTIDEDSMGLTQIEGCGTAAVALKDIPEGHVLFEIPRSLLLSTRTCTLRSKLTESEWTGLGKGWTPLILCMMWEAAKGPDSIWDGYLETMPITFDTPMFWPEADLEELRGTTIFEKIGREDANKEYTERLLPLVKARPDIFHPDHLNAYYTLSEFHIMGSRILSRSFHVERWDGEDEPDAPQAEPKDNHPEQDPDVSMESARSLPIDQPGEEANQQEGDQEGDQGSDSDSEDGEKVEDVAMVPMADMLNARYGGENAKLFYEPHVLKMISTKPISAGDQIWNTYGDPPNSDLLRRYGYVDEIDAGLDIVELKGSVIAECAASKSSLSEEKLKERVDWWLEMGGDDTFTLEKSTPLPSELLSFTQLVLLSESEWQRAQEKEKPPKPKSSDVNECVREAIQKRLGMYPTTLQEDENQLKSGQNTLNKRHALIIRIGEKKVLNVALEATSTGSKKRKADSESGARKKR